MARRPKKSKQQKRQASRQKAAFPYVRKSANQRHAEQPPVPLEEKYARRKK